MTDFTDEDTVTGTTTLSGDELVELVDADTLTNTTTPSSSEQIEVVDAATLTNTTTPSSSELHEIPDAGLVPTVTTPTITETEWFHEESATISTSSSMYIEENFWPCNKGYWGIYDVNDVLAVTVMAEDKATIRTNTRISSAEGP